MSSTLLSFGLVGLGHGMRVLQPAFSLDPRFHLTAIASKNFQTALSISESHSDLKACDHWSHIITDPTVDAVIIAVPPTAQPDIVIAALEANKHVFCEKPLAITASDAHLMQKSATSAGVANMINFMFPDIPHWVTAKELLADGSIGEIKTATIDWRVMTYTNRLGLNNWKASLGKGGGALHAFGSHSFHYIEWLLGHIIEISSYCGTQVEPLVRHKRLNLSLRLINDVRVKLNIDTDSLDGPTHCLCINGTKGRLIINNNTTDYASGFELALLRPNQEPINFEVPHSSSLDGRVMPTYKIAKRFLDWIETGKSSAPDFKIGMRIQKIIGLTEDCELKKCKVNVSRDYDLVY